MYLLLSAIVYITNRHFVFLICVGILCQEERSSWSCRNAWTLWVACQYSSDVSSKIHYRLQTSRETGMSHWHTNLYYKMLSFKWLNYIHESKLIRLPLQFSWNKKMFTIFSVFLISCYRPVEQTGTIQWSIDVIIDFVSFAKLT